MLAHVAEGVQVHQSELLLDNTIVVQGRTGVLVVDAGITGAEKKRLAEKRGRGGRGSPRGSTL